MPWFWWTIYDPDRRGSLGNVVNVLLALLLSPILVPLIIVASTFSRPIRRTPADVAQFIEDFAMGRGGFRDWDDFTSVQIADQDLDEIRIEAMLLEPPEGYREELLALAERTRQLKG